MDDALPIGPLVTGRLLRVVADLAWDGGQKELATSLHELARKQELLEDRDEDGRSCAA